MARSLKTKLPTKEEIVAYEFYLSSSVRVVVGTGSVDHDGNFVQNQEYGVRRYDLVGDAFDDLMAAKGHKPAGCFRIEDLWAAVDAYEAKKVKEEKERLQREKENMANN